MLDSLEMLAVLDRNKRRRVVSSVRRADARRRGVENVRKISGDQATKLIARLDELLPGLAERITEDAYGRIMSRRELRLSERELVNVVVLFIQGFERQLFSHLRGALRVGVKPRTLKAVLVMAANAASKNAQEAMKTVDLLVQGQGRASF